MCMCVYTYIHIYTYTHTISKNASLLAFICSSRYMCMCLSFIDMYTYYDVSPPHEATAKTPDCSRSRMQAFTHLKHADYIIGRPSILL